ncbi:MAG: hypothetical protein WCS87_05320 [Methylococcaceae bacterium]
MNTIITKTLDSLRSLLGKSDLKHLELITEATLSMSGRVTMQERVHYQDCAEVLYDDLLDE